MHNQGRLLRKQNDNGPRRGDLSKYRLAVCWLPTVQGVSSREAKKGFSKQMSAWCSFRPSHQNNASKRANALLEIQVHTSYHFKAIPQKLDYSAPPVSPPCTEHCIWSNQQVEPEAASKMLAVEHHKTLYNLFRRECNDHRAHERNIYIISSIAHLKYQAF